MTAVTPCRGVASRTTARKSPGRTRYTRLRGPLVGLAILRGLLGLVAIPLAPALFHDHFIVLVLLRPTKEVLLAGGFLLRDGSIGLAPLLAASVPLSVLGVWMFYALGRGYAHELQTGDGLGRWTRRVLSPNRVKAMKGLLREKRRLAILVGRLSVFPSTVLASSAGASDIRTSEFIPLDGLGAVLSVAEVLTIGYLFGAQYSRGSDVITVVGVLVLFAGLVVAGRWLRRQAR
jgi:membrane protein DedA with SNARE-associated domain